MELQDLNEAWSLAHEHSYLCSEDRLPSADVAPHDNRVTETNADDYWPSKFYSELSATSLSEEDGL